MYLALTLLWVLLSWIEFVQDDTGAFFGLGPAWLSDVTAVLFAAVAWHITTAAYVLLIDAIDAAEGEEG